jgi:hypothetical protein
MFKEVENFYKVTKGQKARLTARDGDAVLTGTVERAEDDFDYAHVGGIEIGMDIKHDWATIEVEDPPAVLPTTLGSVIKLDGDDDVYLVLNKDGWGSPDYWYEEHEYPDVVANGFEIIFVAAASNE